MEKTGKIKISGEKWKFIVITVTILTVPAWARLIPGDMLHMDIVNIMVMAGIYSCVVIGLNLLIGFAGQVSLGHAAFFGIGAYTTAILCTRFTSFPTWLGVLAGALLACLVGWAVGVPVLKLKGHYLAMATLGLGEIALILFRELKGLTGGTVGILNIPPLSVFGLSFDTDMKFYYLIWIVVLSMMVFSLNLVKSRVGRALRALHSSEVAADAMGIDTARYKAGVFVISALFAGLGGALFAHFQKYISPESFAFSISMLFITMVVVGGMGNMWGSIVGVLVLSFLQPVIAALPYWIPGLPESMTNVTNYSLIIYGLLLVVFMMFMPKGLIDGLARASAFSRRRSGNFMDRIRAGRYRRKQ